MVAGKNICLQIMDLAILLILLILCEVPLVEINSEFLILPAWIIYVYHPLTTNVFHTNVIFAL